MNRITKTALCVLLAALMLVGCSNVVATTAPAPSTTVPGTTQPATTVPAAPTFDVDARIEEISKLGTRPDDNYGVWYEIFVYSFCDSDGNGIGDLKGVISKLDYLQNMGVTGIWLMPIHPSTSYHKYNVRDYYAIDPDYGTMADFDALIAACNERGIKVILDLVVNHSGIDHKWFQEMAEYLKFVPGDMAFVDPSVCPYVDYYHINTTGGTGYGKILGTEFFYECQFSGDMPDLNLASEALRAEIKKIMEFWIGKGVAGFRLDAAKEFYSGQTERNVEVLKFLQETVESIKPDAYMVAEVWDSFAQITKYYESGITSIFNYAFGNSGGKIIDVLRGAGNPAKVGSYATALEKADKAYLGNNPDYIDAPFLSNHDCGRIAGFTSRNEEKTKLAGAMNVLMSGAAFIYYGEEIGMVAGGTTDPDKRAPMVWSDDGTGGITTRPPGCTLPDGYPFGSLAQQQEDPYSIYNYYRQVIAIRNAVSAISHGRTTVEAALNQGCISAQRKTWGKEEAIILININSEAGTADLSAYGDWTVAATVSVGEQEPAQEGTQLQMPGYSIAVLLPNK